MAPRKYDWKPLIYSTTSELHILFSANSNDSTYYPSKGVDLIFHSQHNLGKDS